MNRQGMIVTRLLLCAAMALGMAAWGGGRPEEKNPVKAVFISIGVEKDRMWINGAAQESPLRLEFAVNFSVREPLGFFTQRNDGIQYLEATDSTGRKLAPAEFEMGGMYPQSDRGVVWATITGTAGELPSPDASWVRLKGVLRVPVSRSMKSPIYELPLEEGVEIHMPLPGNNDREEDGAGDIVLSESAPMGRLFLGECRLSEKKGKKVREVELGLAVESSFDLDSFEIVNEKGEILETESRGAGSRTGPSSSEWTKRLQFEDPGNLQKLRFRMIYKVPLEPVPVPVDVKLGMRGEIGDKKK